MVLKSLGVIAYALTDPTPVEMMADLIALVTPVVTFIFTTAGTVISTIVASPYLMFTTGFLVVGGCIKIVRSLLRR